MHLNEIYRETLYGVKDVYDEKDIRLPEKVSSDGLLKVSVYEVGALQELSGVYAIDRSTYSGDGERYPENALAIDLKAGEYAIAYAGGGLVSKGTGEVNACVRSSVKDRLDFGEFALSGDALDSLTQENYESVLNRAGYRCSTVNVVRIQNRSKLHIWVDDKGAVGSLALKAYRVVRRKV